MQLIVASFLFQPLAMAYNPNYIAQQQLKKMEYHPALVWMKNRVEARISKMSEAKKEKLVATLKRKLSRYENRFQNMSEQQFEKKKKALLVVAPIADIGSKRKKDAITTVEKEFALEEMEALGISNDDLAQLPDTNMDQIDTKAMINSLDLPSILESIKKTKESLDTVQLGKKADTLDRLPASASTAVWIIVSVLLSVLAFFSFLYGIVFLFLMPWLGFTLLGVSTVCTAGMIVTLIYAFQ